MRSTLKRFISLVLCMFMVCTLLPNVTMTASAATSGTLTGLSDTNIGLSYSGSADNAWSVGGTSITGAIKSTSGTCSDTDYNSTLTITNKRSVEAQLSFDYTISANGGTIQVANNDVTANGSYSGKLSSGDSIKIYIKSKSTTSATTINLTNISLASDVSATTTFQPAENGKYTVDGKLVEETYTNTQSATTAYKLVATPASGYRFMGWYDETHSQYVSTSATASINIEENCTITAKFSKVGMALFETGGQVYDDLSAAVDYAKGKKLSLITLVADGTISGKYTIPSGITLLIPNSSANTLYTDTPEVCEGDKGTRTAYRTLTLAEESSIDVQGAISVSGWYKSAAGSATGYMTGAYGLISMADSSQITVKSGGKMYAWGFVTGSGAVAVESGGTVMEWFQITDFRGGSATMGMGNKVFPISQYYIQNVEVPMTLYEGATETTYTGVYAMSKNNTSAIPLIGDSGMFKVASGSLTKEYDGSTDQMKYTINGQCELNTLSLKLSGSTVNSKDYVLPITNNISLNIEAGTFTINQTAALLPGVEVYIDKDASAVVSSDASLYVYDMSEWGGYAGGYGQQSIPVAYAPSKKTSRALADAKIDVNGTLTAAGSIYTTASGANICSSEGTGKYIQQSAAGTETKTYQYTQSGSSVTAHEIAITPAKLHNANDSYTTTKDIAAGTTIPYINGTWKQAETFTVSFKDNTETATIADQTVTEGESITLPGITDTREGYTFVGWTESENGSGEELKAGSSYTPTASRTLYAKWDLNYYDYIFLVNGSVYTANTAFGKSPAWDTEHWGTPSKATDDAGRYEFTGWTRASDNKFFAKDTTLPVATDNETSRRYIATFDCYFNVTFDPNDGSGSTSTQEVKQDAEATLEANTFTRTGYTFTGWNTEADGTGTSYSDAANASFSAKTTLYAQWKINTYTVTWVDEDGTVLETDSNVAYGTTPSYDGTTPTKKGDAQYTYTFSGWSPEISAVTADVTYKATYNQTVNQYTITWKNEDGTVLETDQAAYGEVPAYSGETPTKEKTAENTYTFSGWTPEITAVTGDAEYAATYTTTVNKYTVTWKNWDGTVLETDADAAYGTTPAYNGDTPTKTGNAQYSYSFSGWTPSVDKVTGDIIYTANFTETVNQYTITWKNGDTIIKTDQVAYGVTPVYAGETPVKAEDARHTYTFKGWSPEITAVTADAAYTAEFNTIGKNGLSVEENGTYWLENGEPVMNKGLVRVNAGTEAEPHYHYYYFGEDGKAVTNGTYKVENNNNLNLPCYNYEFDKDGIIVHDEDTSKNSIAVSTGDTSGKKYYFIDGVKVGVGLFKVGDDYYYARTSTAEIICGRTYYVSQVNSYNVTKGEYAFDAKGVMQIGKTGWLTEGGYTYYYQNGKVLKGLQQIDGEYYLFNRGNGRMYKNGDYWVFDNENEYKITGGMYRFGTDGKMITVKNGFVTETTKDGSSYTYYYKNGEILKGFQKIGDDYYLFNRSSGKMYKNGNYWVKDNENGNTITGGMYHFDTDGKMVK